MTRPFDADVDLLDPALHASGQIMAVFRELRARSPVAWTRGRRSAGYWSVVGYPELAKIARDVATFSSYWGTRPEVLRPEAAPRPLHNLDPPAHGALRTLAARAVASERLTALEPIARDIASTTIAAFVRRGGGDVVRELAEPVTSHAFASWLGIDRDHAAELWSRVQSVHVDGAALVDTALDDPARTVRIAAARASSEAIATFMREAIADAAPGTALYELYGAAPAGALALSILFVEAGLPTVIDAIGSAFAALAGSGYAGPVDALGVEELLRVASPIAQFARRATKPFDIAGRRIEPGEQVVLWFVSANHDERVFRDPDRLDLARKPDAHFAFGVGPHHCLGSSLGRRIVRACLDAASSYEFAEAAPFERRASSYMRGYRQVPVRVVGKSMR